MARKIYGIYKDDLPACIGTEDECALFLETTINTFRSMYSKQKKGKIKRSRNGFIIVKICEELELRSMYLDFEGVDLPLCTIWLHRLLTGKDHVKQKRTKDNNSEVVAEEKRNVVCKVSVKGYVMSDEELDYLRKACHLASNVAFENDEKNIYRKLNEYLITGERSYDRK